MRLKQNKSPAGALQGDKQAEGEKKNRKKKEKVVITGDDILIEYVRRIKNATKKI